MSRPGTGDYLVSLGPIPWVEGIDDAARYADSVRTDAWTRETWRAVRDAFLAGMDAENEACARVALPDGVREWDEFPVGGADHTQFNILRHRVRIARKIRERCAARRAM